MKEKEIGKKKGKQIRRRFTKETRTEEKNIEKQKE